MAVVTVGIDLAKNLFAVHGVDKNGNAVLNKPKVARAHCPLCYWDGSLFMRSLLGKAFKPYGHDVKLMAPKFVSPYLLAGKNDAADALAICEAVRRFSR